MAGANTKTFVLGLVIGFFTGMIAAVLVVHFGFGPAKKETQTVRDTRVLHMTPSQFVTRCGKLITDTSLWESSDISGSLRPEGHGLPDQRHVTVKMTLPDGEQQNITAVFYDTARKGTHPSWVLGSVGGNLTDAGPLGGLGTIEKLYPCTTKP